MENNNYKKTVFACYRGYITQAVIVNLMPLFFVILHDTYNVSFAMLGSLTLLNFVTQLTTDMIAIKLVDKFGYRKVALVAHFLAALGLALFGVLHFIMPIIPSIVISTVIFSVGGGLLEVIISPIVESVPGDAKEQAMSLLHSFYCWGVVAVIIITTLLLRVMGHRFWMIIPLLWSLLPIYNFFAFLKVPLLPPLSSEERTPLFALLKSKVFIVALLLMTCGGAAELGMAQWASLFTEKALGVSKTVGDIAGPCLFSVTMGIGRIIYGIYGHKIRLLRAIILSSALCIISYLLAALSGNPVLSLAGCAMCGLSVSLMWPGMLSVVARMFTSGGAAMFGLMAVFGDIGCSLGPWLVGIVSQMNSGLGAAEALRLGMLSGVVFPIFMLIGSICVQKWSKC